MNIRHDLDPALVAAQVEKMIARHEQDRITLKEQTRQSIAEYEQAKIDGSAERWQREPKDDGHVDVMINDRVERERIYYSKVRVIERDDGFRLVYGDADDATVEDGTGPFADLERAAAWFMNSGR